MPRTYILPLQGRGLAPAVASLAFSLLRGVAYVAGAFGLEIRFWCTAIEIKSTVEYFYDQAGFVPCTHATNEGFHMKGATPTPQELSLIHI